MTMDFFGRQQHAQNRSALLLVLFVLAMLVMTAAVNVAASSVSYWLGYADTFWHMSGYAMVISGLLWTTIFFGCLFRWMDVRGGGKRLAERYRADPVKPNTRDRKEKMLLDVVAEMSVAASVKQPSVWMMSREHAINAFVLGGDDDIALVVTRGAIESFDRDELQGLVAHEMGHIVQGDLKLNMRLLIVLGGLLAIDEVGVTLGAESESGHPGKFLGILLRVFGSIGVFLGTVIRSAFSRKREFLADACAVQFSRNPQGLLSALHKVQNSLDDRKLESVYSNELAHLCFQIPRPRQMLAKILATHPPLVNRMKAIDKHYEVKLRGENNRRAARRSQSSSDAVGAVTAGGTAAGSNSSILPDVLNPATPLGAAVMVGSGLMSAGVAGSAAPSAAKPASNNVSNLKTDADIGSSGMSDRFELLLPDANAWLSAVFALFASNDEPARREYLNSIAFAYKKPFADSVEKIYNTLGDQLQEDLILSIEFLAPRLKNKLQMDNRMRLLKNLEKLVELEGEHNLTNYSALQFLRHRLEADFPTLTSIADDGKVTDAKVKVASKRKVPTLEDIAEDIALLLSLLVEASGNKAERVEADYTRVLKCYTNRELKRRSASEVGIVREMEHAFNAVLSQPVSMRKGFIEHCVEITQSDHHVNGKENMLVDLFAASLDVRYVAKLAAA